MAGLYAGIAPAIVGSLTARTVLMVTTLTSAIALTSQSVLKEAGLDPADPGTIATLTVMAGVVMVLSGVLRLGAVMSFVSNAVMTGFATGIALQLITGTLKDATGHRLMVLTFLATTQLPLQQAIVLGAVISLLPYCVQAARQARFLALLLRPHLRPRFSGPAGRIGGDFNADAGPWTGTFRDLWTSRMSGRRGQACRTTMRTGG
ncbi:SulP family inorganic anion transporter [Streptomyces aureus]|uniref:SulP family inorganic anion transporter n=1 Tax=Streptomyces aureus TaxID=193461 RepID=UPI00315973D1